MSDPIIDELNAIRDEALGEIGAAVDVEALEHQESKVFGRKSRFSEISRDLRNLAEDQRRQVGQAANEARSALRAAIEEKRSELESAGWSARLERERLDLTLPGRTPPTGRIHPITQTIEEIVDIFVGLGFKMVEGPIVETDYYNFEALNMPPNHAARSMHDTLYVDDAGEAERRLIRTHTSPMQVRIMETTPPPVYVIVPGICGRNEEVDANHLAIFTQVEGLAVDEGISFADLKGTLDVFAKKMFGANQRVRLHPSYFPFTEPSAEVYVSCFACDGSGCPVCRNEGWIEVMGAGMVHPGILTRVGYDTEKVSGFAFGLGPERIAKLRFGVTDLRLFYENDLRFLEAF